MTQPPRSPNWKALGLFACALALSLSLQATDASAADSPGVALLATDPSALAGTSSGAFTLVRHGDTNLTLSVTVDISGTATNGVDYTSIDNVLTLDPGVLALDVVVQPVVNPANRGNKTVILTLQNNAAYRVIGRPTATVKIIDDLYDVPPPSVTLTSPGDGSVFTTSTSITLSADASDSQLEVQSVSFYADDNFLGKVTNSRYTLVWTNPHTGQHALFARAVDQFGKSGVSTPVDITVSDVPVVTVTPPDGTSVFQGELVQLQAQIGDPNEAIQSVSFTLNGKPLGTVTSAPFIVNWQTTNNGIFTVQAVATDKHTGKKGSSAKVHITVTPNSGN